LLNEQSLKPGGRAVVECVVIGLDFSKESHARAVAEGGRDDEVRSYGEIRSDSASIRGLVRKLERPCVRLRFCYEAGPTDYGLKRLIEWLGHIAR
jgi:transposase